MSRTSVSLCLLLAVAVPRAALGDDPPPDAPSPPAEPATTAAPPPAAPVPAPAPPPVVEPARAAAPLLLHTPPGGATTGGPVDLAFELVHPELVKGAEVRYRRAGSSGGFRAAPVQRGTDGAWTVTLPRPAAGVDGIEYYVTLTRRDGTTEAAFANERDPHTVVVHPTRDDSQEAADLLRLGGNRLDLAAGGELTNFGSRRDENGDLCGAAGKRCRDDSYSLYGAVRYHFLRQVRSVGVRVTRIDGKTTRGGAEHDLGLVGAAIDVEIRLHAAVSLTLLGLLGADETTVQPGAGAALAVGLGEPARLEFGLRGMSDVGWAFDTWMRWLTVRSTPLGAGIELTTMPGNNANAALRLMLEIGRQLGRHVLVTLRGGYGARDLEGGGATLGGQVQVSL